MHLLQAFQHGFLSEFQDQILYIHLKSIPRNYINDGWLAEAYLRNYMSNKALERLKNLSDQDLFLSFDADEIPKMDVLTFLKWHQNVPSVFQFNLRWSVFKFYWVNPGEKSNHIIGGSTVQYLRDHCSNQVYQLRARKCIANFHSDVFEMGTDGNYAGHHCSWCYDPSGIRIKLISAQKADGPRWGDYPEKLDLSYIITLIQDGKWFDGSKPFKLILQSEEPDFAPLQILEHFDNYTDLLVPPKSVIEKERGKS